MSYRAIDQWVYIKREGRWIPLRNLGSAKKAKEQATILNRRGKRK